MSSFTWSLWLLLFFCFVFSYFQFIKSMIFIRYLCKWISLFLNLGMKVRFSSCEKVKFTYLFNIIRLIAKIFPISSAVIPEMCRAWHTHTTNIFCHLLRRFYFNWFTKLYSLFWVFVTSEDVEALLSAFSNLAICLHHFCNLRGNDIWRMRKGTFRSNISTFYYIHC